MTPAALRPALLPRCPGGLISLQLGLGAPMSHSALLTGMLNPSD